MEGQEASGVLSAFYLQNTWKEGEKEGGRDYSWQGRYKPRLRGWVYVP